MKFNESILYGMKNKRILNKILGLGDLFDLKNANTSEIYEEKYMNKKTFEYEVTFIKGITRKIIVPKDDKRDEAAKHKASMKKMNKLLQSVFDRKETEFIRSTLKKTTNIDNALLHANGRFGFMIDMKDYFTNIPRKKIAEMFVRDFKMSTDAAAYLAATISFIHNNKNVSVLPQGFPTSPVVSSLVNLPAFKEINDFCINNKIKFSVYVDDMTFTSNESISKAKVEKILSILKSHHIKINFKKYIKPAKISLSSDFIVTGVNIKADKIFPHMKSDKWNTKNYMARLDALIKIISKTDLKHTKANYLLIWKTGGEEVRGGYLPEFCGIFNYLKQFHIASKGRVKKSQRFRIWDKNMQYYESFYDVYIKAAFLFGKPKSHYKSLSQKEINLLKKIVKFKIK